jgi:hypothetical protein
LWVESMMDLRATESQQKSVHCRLGSGIRKSEKIAGRNDMFGAMKRTARKNEQDDSIGGMKFPLL